MGTHGGIKGGLSLSAGAKEICRLQGEKGDWSSSLYLLKRKSLLHTHFVKKGVKGLLHGGSPWGSGSFSYFEGNFNVMGSAGRHKGEVLEKGTSFRTHRRENSLERGSTNFFPSLKGDGLLPS